MGTYTEEMVEEMVTKRLEKVALNIKKEMNGLSERKPMSDFDKGYNSCLDDCLAIIDSEIKTDV